MPERDPVVAYLVLSHHHRQRVEALAERILELSPSGHVVVHHDAEDQPFAGSPPKRVHLVDPVRVNWGDWSVVEATLRLLRHARENLDASWSVMLSGDDRPVVDLEVWERDVLSGGLDAIVSARPITRRPRFGRRPTADDLNFARYAYRWRALAPARSKAARLALESARRASRFLQPAFKIEYAPRRDRWFLGTPRRERLGYDLYCGAQWMALGAAAADLVLGADTRLVAWFEETWIPDQGFVHTVLYNQPGLNISNSALTYVVPKHVARERPKWMTLRAQDFEAIRSSGAAFARKFDPCVDASVCEMVDAAVDEARGHGEPLEPVHGPDASRAASRTVAGGGSS